MHSNNAYVTGLVPGPDNLQFADKQYSPWYPKLFFSWFVNVMHTGKF